MTYLEAAYIILSEAGRPLHYREIAKRALAQGLIQPTGLTPDATMGSRLYVDTKQDGSRFLRVGRGMFSLAERQPRGIDAQVETINQTTRAELKKKLHEMPPDRFEALVGELLIQMGFDENTVKVTRRSSDGGIDVLGVYRAAGLTQVNVAVQVKRWRKNVSAPIVTQLRGSLQVHQQGIIITTSDFSKGARKEANAPNKTRIGLLNGKELLELLVKYRIGVVEKTLTVIDLDEEWWGEMFGDTESTQIAKPTRKEKQSKLEKKPSDTKTKPIFCTVLGNTYPVNTWKEVLLTTCKVLASRHPNTFLQQAMKIRGQKRQYIADRSEGMRRPEPIGDTGLWVETNLSARDIRRITDRLLTAFGYNIQDPEVFAIETFEPF